MEISSDFARRTRKPFLTMVMALLVACPGMASATTSKVTYYLTDQQGTPLVEMDASGAVTASHDYAPYGRSVLGAPGNGPGYTGHVSDDDSGLVYMQARYYDPTVGRFLSPDPSRPSAGDLFTQNRFVYTENAPTVHTDPSGRCVEDLCIGETILLVEGVEYLIGVVEASEVVAATTETGVVATTMTATTATTTTTAAGATATLDTATGALASSSGSSLVETASACASSSACTGTVALTAVAATEVVQNFPTAQQQAEHTSGKRKSTEGKHEKGNSRRNRDKGGEKADDSRRPGRNPPPNWKGPWPPPKAPSH